ncbi:MAG: class II glutamine amidotransferase, partial [Chloroherpetonaceae bacterium]
LQGTTDSEHIFNLYLTIREEQPKLTMREAVLELFERLNHLGKKHEADLILNFGFNDGITTIATCYTNIDKSATLYYTTSSPFFPDAIVVASEPLDYRDPSWKKFPVNHLIEISSASHFEFAPIPNPFFKEGALPAAKPVTLKISMPTEAD